MTIELKVTEGLAPQEETTILDRLRAYNAATFGDSERRDLTIPLYDVKGEMTGGLVGYTARGWLHISMLYIPEKQRGKGIATRMIAMAEAEACNRGCIGAYLDTINPAAQALYEKLGYTRIGRLDGLAGGQSVTWLEKRF